MKKISKKYYAMIIAVLQVFLASSIICGCSSKENNSSLVTYDYQENSNISNNSNNSDNISNVSTSQTITTAPTTTTTTSTTTTTTTTTTITTMTTTSTTTTKAPEVSPIQQAKYKIEPIKSKYKSSATAFACVEMILKYYGYESSQSEMISYLSTDTEFYTQNGKTYGPNPDLIFVGNPSSTIYGSYGYPIYEALEQYFEKNNISVQCDNIDNSSFNAISSMLKDGYIPIVWMVNNKDDNHVYYDKNSFYGETAIIYPKNINCMVIIGITNNSIILSDPTTEQIIELSKQDYEQKAFEQVIKIKQL